MKTPQPAPQPHVCLGERPFALTITDAVRLGPFSADTLKRAIRAGDLRAKRDTRGRYIILTPDFEQWLEDALRDT